VALDTSVQGILGFLQANDGLVQDISGTARDALGALRNLAVRLEAPGKVWTTLMLIAWQPALWSRGLQGAARVNPARVQCALDRAARAGADLC
jgi:hypothetical protein